MNLYDVAVDGLVMEQELTESGGELTPELERRLDNLLQSGKEKLEAAARVVRNLEAQAEACKEESKRLAERQSSFNRQAKSLKARMAVALDAAFGGKIKTALFTIWSQRSKPSTYVVLAPNTDLGELRKRRPDLVREVSNFELEEAVILSIAEAASEDTPLRLPAEIKVETNPGTLYCKIR